MEVENLDALHSARPFRQFILHLSDGREVRVSHPELLARGGATAVVFEQPGNHMRIIDLAQVTELSLIDGGRPKSRKRA
jgi:hypothetical protein